MQLYVIEGGRRGMLDSGSEYLLVMSGYCLRLVTSFCTNRFAWSVTVTVQKQLQQIIPVSVSVRTKPVLSHV